MSYFIFNKIENMGVILNIIYKFSEWFMYILTYLVNGLHLNYFVMIITFAITAVATCAISFCLRLFGINDSIENDKKIVRKLGALSDLGGESRPIVIGPSDLMPRKNSLKREDEYKYELLRIKTINSSK